MIINNPKDLVEKIKKEGNKFYPDYGKSSWRTFKSS